MSTQRLYAAIVYALLSVLLGHSSAFAQAIQLAVSNSTLSLPIWVAHKQGFFKANNVEVEIKPCFGGNRCLQMVSDKQAQIATCTDIPFLTQTLSNAKLDYLASMTSNSNDSGVVVRLSAKNNGIATIKPGMKIGTVWGTSAHYYLDLFLTYHLVDPSSITVVKVPAGELQQSLVNGQVDAIAFWEPHISEVIEHDPQMLKRVHTPRLLATTFNLIADQNFIEDHQVSTIAMLKAIKQAITYIHEHPQEAKAIMRENLPEMSEALANRQWVDLEFDLKIPALLPKALYSQAKWMQQIGLVSKDAKLNQISNHVNGHLLGQIQEP